MARQTKRLKSAKQMERNLKGIANHWRIEVIMLIARVPGINLEGIVKSLKGNYTTLAIHTSKLVQAGLVGKRYKGRQVEHRLSPYGKNFIIFLTSLQHY